MKQNESNTKMNLMASTFLALLALVGIIAFIVNFSIVDSSLLVPLTTAPTKPTTTTTTEKIITTTWKPFNCKKMLLSMGKKVFKQFGICNRDMKVFIPNEKEREKKLQCSIKCLLKKLKLVNEKDLVTPEALQNFLDGFLPSDFHEAAHIITDGCVEEFVERGEGPLKEDYCESYGDFLRCLQDNFSGLC